MFNDDWYKERMEEISKANMQRQEEIKRNPLSQYNTSQLKGELRRRKRG
jgi:hypothetical protein